MSDGQTNHSANWILKLYVAGQTPRSMRALANLKRICEEHLAGGYTIQVVDLLENPTLAADDQIFALPTLVRELPPPMRKIIGDLSETEKVLVGLNILPGQTESGDGRVQGRSAVTDRARP